MKDFGCFNLAISQWYLSDVSRQQCYAKAPSHTRPQVLRTVWRKMDILRLKKRQQTYHFEKLFVCSDISYIISHHYAGYMFAPNVERLLWRAVNWNATNLFTRGRNRSSALSRAAERDSRSTSTWGHTCAFILEIAPTSAPLRYLTSSKVIIRWTLLFRRVATRSLRNRQTWSHTSWRTRNKSLVGARSRRQIPFLEVIQTLTHTGDDKNNWGPWGLLWSIILRRCATYLNPTLIAALTSQTRHIFSQTVDSLYKRSLFRWPLIFVKPNLRDKNHPYQVEVASPEEQQFIVYTE